MATKTQTESKTPAAEHEHGHAEQSFWTKYIFSTDHKVIGIQYGIGGLMFLMIGFTLIMLMRWNIAKVDPATGDPQAIPVVGPALEAVFGYVLGQFLIRFGAAF